MGRLSTRDRKLAYAAGENPSNVENDAFSLTGISASQTVLGPPPPLTIPGAALVASAQRVYWVYLGYTQKTLVVDYVQFIQVSTLAGGTQVAEVGLATSTSAADGTAKTLTVVAASGLLPDLTTGSTANGLVRQNLTTLAYTVSPATHLWACARFQMATTQPTVVAVGLDLQIGLLQFTAGVAIPLSVGTPYAGSLTGATPNLSATSPYLRLVVSP